MPTQAETDLQKPNRRTVEALFNDLSGYHAMQDAMADHDKLQEELKAMEAELLDVPAYRALKRKVDRAYQKGRNHITSCKEKVAKVKRRYLAEGLTPSVMDEIKKLVANINGKK